MLNGLIPCPDKIELFGDKLAVTSLESIRMSDGLERYGNELVTAFRYFGKELNVVDSDNASITFGVDETLAAEGWRIQITSDGISIRGGSGAGVFYATGAMKQLLALAFAQDGKSAAFECGTVTDQPRNEWRGLMLDSVRHFQSKEKIKEVIKLISDWRLNVFHWHLTDIQGYRLPSNIVPKPDDGYYTREDLKEIIAYAAERHVRIVPELDMPGHSEYLLKCFPEYACDSEGIGYEFCLGNPEGKEFLQSLLEEMMELFPDSPIIHIGGDEAGTARWEKCPKCQEALKKSDLRTMRELESQFMNEMTRFVVSKGRRPMVWCTETVYPPDTMVQAWTSILEIMRTHPHGNQMVNSVHHCCYFDYPYDSTDPKMTWMPPLPEDVVYQAFEPLPDHRDLVKGTEACLWTEMVPQWRVVPKIVSRLAAFAEHAWTRPENKDWHDFQRRKMQLRAVGYDDLLKMD